jgi:hypothetical protein
MKKNTWLLALLVVCVLAALVQARDAFVGTWKITVSPDEDAIRNKAKEFKDTVTFKGSQFESAELKQHGFPATTYEEDTRGGVAATFKCEMKSKTEGKAVWSGISTGVDIQGELTWTKADGTELKYTFKGEKPH